MLLGKKIIVHSVLTVLFLFIPIFAGAVNFTQTITLEKDGSGIIKLIYSEKESLVKEKNYLIGNLPFSKDKSEEYFTSSNTSIRIFTVEKDPKDNTLTQVTVAMNFKDVNRINEMKALSSAQVSLKDNDSGRVFTYIITPALTKSNSIDNIYTILTYKGVIKSSNGKITGSNADWFRGKEFLNTKNISLFAILESDKKTSGNTTTEEKGKSCGLFGLELPFILLVGLAFSGRLKKRN